jgi:hypothetical protein
MTDVEEPIINEFYALNHHLYSIQVQSHQGSILIQSASGQYQSYFEDFRIDLGLYSEGLRKFRHEFVSSLHKEDTDYRLSKLDPLWVDEKTEQWYHKYTPDIHNPMTGKLLEIGTVMSTDIRKLRDDFTLKKKKYQEAAMILKVSYIYVLIAGPDEEQDTQCGRICN